MSWLSKKLGGNTLKVGAALLGSTVAKEYLFGETSSHGYDISTGSYTAPKYTGDNLVAAGFNKLGITPFGETAVGSFLSPALDFVKESGLASFATQLGSGEERSLQFSDLPSVSGVQAQGIRTATNFQPGRASQIPVGKSGAVSRALTNPNVQNYLAKRARQVGLPTIQTATPTVSARGTSLASTTSAKRRARSRLVG